MATDLCNFLQENNIKLDKDTASKIVAYMTLYAIENLGNAELAIDIIDQAREKGIRSNALDRLHDTILLSYTISVEGKRLRDIVARAAEELASGIVSESTIRALESAIRDLEGDLKKAEELGIHADTHILDVAHDIIDIINNYRVAQEAMEVMSGVIDEAREWLNEVSNASSIEDLGLILKRGEAISIKAQGLENEIYKAITRLEGLALRTSEGREIRDRVLSALKTMRAVAEAINRFAGHASILGTWLREVMNMIKKAYESPKDSPFGAARDSFVNLVSSLLAESRFLVSLIDSVKSMMPADAPQDAKAFIDSLEKAAEGLASGIELILKNLKYATTFNDFRWNKIWEAAESAAGVDLGEITAADVYRYEFKGCDANGCHFEERGGVTGWLAEHVPEEALVFWTTVEDALRDIEQYNRWLMNYAKDPISKALWTVGYVGASMLQAIGTILSPKMLAEQITVLKDLIKKWVDGLVHASKTKVEEAARDTWDLFFGSREAALATLGALILSIAVSAAVARRLPPGSLREAVIKNLAQGDVIGAGLEVVARLLPDVRIRGVARALVEEGAVKTSELADDAGIIARATKMVETSSKIHAVMGARKFEEIVKSALKRSESLEEAHKALEDLIREDGLEALVKEAEKYRAIKTEILSNLASMEVRAPRLFDRIKSIAKKSFRERVEEKDLPPTLAEELRAVDSESIVAGAKEAASKGATELLLELSERGVVSKEVVGAVRSLEEAISEIEKSGRRDVAEALRRIEENYTKLAGELKALSDLKNVIDELNRISEVAKEKGLWRESVDEAINRKVIDRILRREKETLSEHLARLSSEIEERLRRLSESYEKLGERISELGEMARNYAEKVEAGFIKRIAEPLSEIDPSLAGEIESLAKERIPLREKIARIFERVGERLGAMVDERLKKLAETAPEGEAATVAKEGGVPRILAKFYYAGLKVGDWLANTFQRLAERLRGEVEPAALEELARRVANAIEEAYGKASVENLALLKGLKKALEKFEGTPIGALLSELDRTVTRIIEAEERAVGSEFEKLLLREEAQEALRKELSPEGALFKLFDELSESIDRVAAKLEERLSGDERLARLAHMADTLVEEGAEPSEIMEELRSSAESMGYAIPDEAWKALEEYVELRVAGKRLEDLIEASKGGALSLEEAQKAVNYLARIDLDAAFKTDWTVVRGYVSSIMRELEEAKRLAREAGEEGLLKSIEEVENRLRVITEKQFIEGPFTRLREVLEVEKAFSSLAADLDSLVDVIARGVGEEKVAKLRSLVEEFKEKLRRGEFDASLLKSIKSELAKLKIKGLPDYLRAKLGSLASSIRELVARIARGKEAALIERSLRELADEIEEIRKKHPEVEKGWVREEVEVSVGGYEFIRVPRELAERVSRILSEREKVYEITTREGHKVRVRREIDVRPDGTFHIHYEIEFPGGRKIIFDEVAKAEKGRLHVYRDFWYDPELARALEAYEEVKKGVREMDDLARLGEDVDDIIKRGLEEIDPDYEVLSRIAFVTREGRRLLGDILSKSFTALASALTTAALELAARPKIGKVSGMERPAMGEEVSIEEIEKIVPKDIFKDIEEALKDAVKGMANPRELVLLSLVQPVASRLRSLYERLQPATPLEELPEDLRDIVTAIRNEYMIDVADIAPYPGEWPLPTLVWPQKGELGIGKEKIYIVKPKLDENWIVPWTEPEMIIEIHIPEYNMDVELPAIKLEDRGILVAYIPPIAIQLPKEITEGLEIQPPSEVEAEQPGYKEVPHIPPLLIPPTGGGGGGGAAGGAAPVPPIPGLPVLPWGVGATAGYGGKQRERLHV